MAIELLLAGLFVLLVLGLLVAVVYSIVIIFDDAIAQDTPGQQRFLTASILNFLTQLEE